MSEPPLVPDAPDADDHDAADFDEDEDALLSPQQRALEDGPDDMAAGRLEVAAVPTAPSTAGSSEPAGAPDEELSDVAGLPAAGESSPLPASLSSHPSGPRLDTEPEVRAIAAELRAIEGEVRSILQERDPKRKRKLAGTRRWLELEEDVINLRYTGRLPEDDLRRLHRLVMRRHGLFRRLRFLAGTRPVWNS
jgi:hypothetical protein